MIQSLIAFFTALPSIVSLIERIGAMLKQKETQDFLNDLDQAILAIEQAKSAEDKRRAASGLARVIRSLR